MITLVIGRQGSGKTLLLVKKAYEYYKKGKTIYSNIKLNFPFKPIDYNDIIECKLENAVVILDEIHLLLSSRNSMSKINRLIVDGFLSMVRKMGLTIIASTQTERKVDVRFREEKDFLYACNKYAYINNTWQEVLHNQNLDKSVPLMIHLDIREEFSMNWIAMSFIGNQYFDLYDTTEIVKIKGVDDEEIPFIEIQENEKMFKLKQELIELKKENKKQKIKLQKYEQVTEDIKTLNKLM